MMRPVPDIKKKHEEDLLAYSEKERGEVKEKTSAEFVMFKKYKK